MLRGFEIVIADDPDHDKVFAEIMFDNKFVALISQELGPTELQLEMPGLGLDEAQVIRTIPLEGFISAVGRAAKKLVGDT